MWKEDNYILSDYFMDLIYRRYYGSLEDPHKNGKMRQRCVCKIIIDRGKVAVVKYTLRYPFKKEKACL